MDKYFKHEFIAKGIIGIVGLVVSIVAYFLVDRDVEIRKKISNLEASSRVCEITSGQLSANVAEIFRTLQTVERACCQWENKKQ